MAASGAHMFLGFPTPVLTQFSFKSHQLLFSHASELRGGKNAEMKVPLYRLLNSQPPGHESDTLITEPPGQVGSNGVLLLRKVSKEENVYYMYLKPTNNAVAKGEGGCICLMHKKR